MSVLALGESRVAGFLSALGWRAISVLAATPIPFGLVGGRGSRLCNERGQGTTEYAILVGVLVVIAIAAISLFRPRLQELWTSIAEGINGL